MQSLLCLDDGCLMRVLELLTPLPDRFNTAISCKVGLGGKPVVIFSLQSGVLSLSEPPVDIVVEAGNSPELRGG